MKAATNAPKAARGAMRARVQDLIGDRRRELTPSEIARVLQVSKQAVDYHLRRLRAERNGGP